MSRGASYEYLHSLRACIYNASNTSSAICLSRVMQSPNIPEYASKCFEGFKDWSVARAIDVFDL